MLRKKGRYFHRLLTCAVMAWLTIPTYTVWADDGTGGSSVSTADVHVDADAAKEEAKYESQSTTIITAEDIARKQAKSVEDVVFNEVGVTRTIDAMGNVGVSIRGGDPRHTLLLVDGQRVLAARRSTTATAMSCCASARRTSSASRSSGVLRAQSTARTPSAASSMSLRNRALKIRPSH